MEDKSKSPSFYVLNVGGLLLVLSIVGSTSRFIVISATFITWLQTQWLAYTSALKKRRSARLAATANDERIRKRQQILDVSKAIGESLISTLAQRRQELVRRLDQETERKRSTYQQDIVKRITENLAEFQETERIKDEQRLKLREVRVSARERELKQREEASQARQKDLDEREQRLQDRERAIEVQQKKLEKREQKENVAGDNNQRTHQKHNAFIVESRIVNRPPTVATPNSGFTIPPSINKSITLPWDLARYAEDLNSYHFTCIGTTQKGTRCRQSMISNADKSAATRRIAQMASPDSKDGITLYEIKALRELADWMLCPRWHRDKLPQGDRIASKWYIDLTDARRSNAQAVSFYQTPSSAGVSSVFGSANTKNNSVGTTASSFGSSVQSFSLSYASPNYQSVSPASPATSTSGQELFKQSAPRNLTPMFGFMAEQSATTKRGFGQY